MERIITLLVAVLCTLPGAAQSLIGQRTGVEASIVPAATQSTVGSFCLNLSLIRSNKRGSYWMYGVEYYRANVEYKSWHLPVENYTAEVGFNFQLLADRRRFITLNAGAFGIAGYEGVNQGSTLLKDGAQIQNRSGLIYGTALRLGVDFHLTQKVAVVFYAKPKLLLGTTVERHRIGAGLGLRYNF